MFYFWENFSVKDSRKVSIIIPAYNCEKYLSKCLQTVTHQTYENIEIIIVDDGSTDCTSNICDEYAKQFSTIKVFHQNNAGPGIARNAALEAMTGDYVTYIDADDYVAQEYVEIMVGLLEKYCADIAEVGLICLQRVRNVFDDSDGTVKCFEGAEVLIQDYFSGNGQLRNCVGGRMYNMKKFRDIRFSEKCIGEDSEYSLKMLSNCDRLVKYHKCLYVCRAYQESLTRAKLNQKNFDVVEVALRDVMLAEKQKTELIDWDYVFRNFISICYGLLQRVASERKEKEFAPDLENMISVFQKMRELAKSHGIELSGELIKDIQHIEIWAKQYRRENWFQLFVIKRIKGWISRMIAFYKIKTLYEYKFEH